MQAITRIGFNRPEILAEPVLLLACAHNVTSGENWPGKHVYQYASPEYNNSADASERSRSSVRFVDPSLNLAHENSVLGTTSPR
jgi:hypothetical protein